MDGLLQWIRQYCNFCDKASNIKHMSIVAGGIISYLLLVRSQRYRYVKMIRQKYSNPQIVLENGEAAQEIHAILMKKEFPFIGREATEFALFKTFTIPSISKLLVATDQFGQDASRRAEDTELILNEIVDTYARIEKQLANAPNTPKNDIDAQWNRPKAALKRLNELHGKYNILNEDYIYTLSLFIFEPVSWINRYEWRALDEREINALFKVWYDVGVGMNIKNLPDTPAKMLAFKEAYAQKAVTYSPSNWKCGEPTVRHLLSNLPLWLQQLAYKVVLRVLPSVLDPEDAAAFHLPHQESKLITYILRSALRLRALFLRHLAFPRSQYLNRTPFYANEAGRYVPEFEYYKRRIYREGYRISELGPDKFKPTINDETTVMPPFAADCPFSRHK